MSSDVTRVMDGPVDESGQPMAIISDIHSNLTALQAVLADIAARGIDRIVCLGDVIGYGPDPVECWRLVRQVCRVIIRGNHDQALGQTDMARFHPRAKSAIEWTRRRMFEEADGIAMIEEISTLPKRYKEGDHLYVHGSPNGPTMDYLLPGDAFDKQRMALEFAEVDLYAFNGHTHIPGVLQRGGRFLPPENFADGRYFMSGRQAIINVGSVGQPRDGSPLACYLTVEAGYAAYHRVAYDAEAVCERILAIQDLDPFLGRRLLAGY